MTYPYVFAWGEGTDGFEAQPPTAALTQPQQPATAVPLPQPSRPDVDSARAPDSDNAHDASPAAGDQEEQANQEAQTAETEVPGGTVTQVAEEPEVKPTPPGTNASWPATPPETPERDVAPAPQTEHAQQQAAEPEPDVDTAKPEGCTTPPPPPPPVHGRGSPMHGMQAGASVKRDVSVAASKSRLFSFRSFARDKKVIKPPGAADTASPDRRKEGEAGAENKEKGKGRRKRFWK